MITTISSKDLDRVLVLPEEIDTNAKYELVDTNGGRWPVVYDTITESWVCLAF